MGAGKNGGEVPRAIEGSRCGPSLRHARSEIRRGFWSLSQWPGAPSETAQIAGDCRLSEQRSPTCPQRDNPTGIGPVGSPSLPSYSFITAIQRKQQTERLAEIAPDGFPSGRQSGTAPPPRFTNPERCVNPGPGLTFSHHHNRFREVYQDPKCK